MRTTRWAGVLVLGVIGAAGCAGKVTEPEGAGGGGSGGSGAGPTSSSSSSGSPVLCPPPEPKNHLPEASACAPTTSTMACKTDADCTTGMPAISGKCVTTAGGMTCNFDACLQDSDCSPSTSVCSCEGQTFGWAHTSFGNTCIPANCHADGDCGTGLYCSPTVDASCGGFYGVVGFYCHTCQDTCSNDSDCPAVGNTPAGYCAFDPSVGHWACGYGFCAG